MRFKVYYVENYNDNGSNYPALLFESREFGILECFTDGDILHHSSWKHYYETFKEYENCKSGKKCFEENSCIIYLGLL